MKERLRKILPLWAFTLYYKAFAYGSALALGSPSRRMVVIGVTGTKGKSSTVMLIRDILREAGYRVGWTSSISFSDGEREVRNNLHMSMPGRFFIQRWLARMVRRGCDYAVIEVTSEGIKQFRHLGLHFDVAVFTNLAPEHLEAHGSFEAYRTAKERLFRVLKHTAIKHVRRDSQVWRVAKVSIVNIDSEYAPFFLNIPVDHAVGFSILNRGAVGVNELVRAEHLSIQPSGSTFRVRGVDVRLRLPGTFNVYNALAAIAVGITQGVSLLQIQAALEKVRPPAGRMQFIDGGQSFNVVIDYAHTPDSLRAVYESLRANVPAGGRLVGILGATGGGRDTWKRPVLGAIAQEYCDEIVITDEDPYDEDPLQIMHNVMSGITRRDKVRLEPDRRLALRYAFTIAKPRDTVVITGKGSEQTMIVGGRAEPWSDADVAHEELEALGFRPQSPLAGL